MSRSSVSLSGSRVAQNPEVAVGVDRAPRKESRKGISQYLGSEDISPFFFALTQQAFQCHMQSYGSSNTDKGKNGGSEKSKILREVNISL